MGWIQDLDLELFAKAMFWDYGHERPNPSSGVPQGTAGPGSMLNVDQLGVSVIGEWVRFIIVRCCTFRNLLELAFETKPA